MRSTRTQIQLATATPISSYVQFQISFRQLPSSVATTVLIEILLRYIYSLSTLENTDIFSVRSPHKHFGKSQHLVL